MKSLEHHANPPSRKKLFGGAALVAALLGGAYGAYAFFKPKPFDPVTTAAGQALGRAVPGYLIEIDYTARTGIRDVKDLSSRAATILSPEARAALGPEVSAPLETLLKNAAELTAEGAEDAAASEAFLSGVVDVNNALAGRKLPYFLDADLLVGGDPPRKRPLLFSFYVERDAEVLAEGTKVRAVFVRRLDHLNVGQAYLGYTRPRTPAAIILLDEIESQLVQYVLPAQHEAADALLVDLESLDRESAWQKELHARAATIVRDAHHARTGIDLAAVDRIGEILARRRALVRSWRASMLKAGLRLHVPRRLHPEGDYPNDLWGKVPVNELREWREIHEELQEPELERVFYQLRDERAQSVEEHEVQHRLDYRRGFVGLPDRLAAMVGARDSLDVGEGSLPARARDELSAYLAEIARAKTSPMLELMLLSQFAFDRTEWGGAYCYAALAVMDGLGRELGLPDEPLVGRGQVLRDRLTARFLAITSRSPDEVRGAARRLWQTYYGGALADAEEVSATAHVVWQH